MDKKEILTVGGLPIGGIEWEDFELYRQQIIDFCLSKEKVNTIESNVGVGIKNNLWESDFNFLNNPELQPLNNWLNVTITEFISTINRKQHRVGITESWAHVARPNGFHGPHRHPWATWSGIFYVYADDETNGSNVFFNHFNLPRLPGYEFFEEQITIPFKAGSLVIFPSTMLHYAKPYLGNDKRIVISFNSVVFKQ